MKYSILYGDRKPRPILPVFRNGTVLHMQKMAYGDLYLQWKRQVNRNADIFDAGNIIKSRGEV